MDKKIFILKWRNDSSKPKWLYTLFAFLWSIFCWWIVAYFISGFQNIEIGLLEWLGQKFLQHPLLMVSLSNSLMIGVLFIYCALALWLNEYQYIIQGNKLTVKIWPFWWRKKNQIIDLTHFDSAKIDTYSTKDENASEVKRHRITLYFHIGSSVEIAEGLGAHDNAQALALWIQQQLKK